MKAALEQEKRFDQGAWLILVSMSLFAIVVLVPTLYILRMPGDGWQNIYQEVPLNAFVGDWPTPLQKGDIVLAVDDVSVTKEFTQVSPLLPAPPSWQEGSTIAYLVERSGRKQTIDVTLHLLSPSGVLNAVSNTALADLPLLSWFFIGLIVFILRPGSTAARLFFVAGTTLALGTRIGWAAEMVSANFAPPIIWLMQRYIHSFWEMIFFPSLIVLLLIYFGSVVLLQSLFTATSGQELPLTIVISTLIIAALFSPLRQRIQAIIDRRFYRKKYDIQRVLGRFALAARDETDIDVLSAELVDVVQETIQSEELSLWIRPLRTSGSPDLN